MIYFYNCTTIHTCTQAWRGNVWKYIASEVRSSSLSSESNEEGARNLQLLENYLTYVQSSREHRELLGRYQGRGERSVEESAHLVGLELPNQSTAWNQSMQTVTTPPPQIIQYCLNYHLMSLMCSFIRIHIIFTFNDNNYDIKMG